MTGRKAVVIFVPYKLLKVVHKIQSRCDPRPHTRWHPHTRPHIPHPTPHTPMHNAHAHTVPLPTRRAADRLHRVWRSHWSVRELTPPLAALAAHRLVRELEKKFSGKHVVLIGSRRIMRKPSAGQRQPKQKRPRSRTLTSVHEAILEDLVYPTEIVGKHTRYRLDGSKICKARVYI